MVGDVTLDAGHVVPDGFQVGGRYLRSPGHNNFKLQENIILFIELISNKFGYQNLLSLATNYICE